MNLCLIPQTHTPNLQTVFLISGLTTVRRMCTRKFYPIQGFFLITPNTF